jgi:hypothetical protein
LIPATHEAPILIAIVEIKFIAPDYTTAARVKFEYFLYAEGVVQAACARANPRIFLRLGKFILDADNTKF